MSDSDLEMPIPEPKNIDVEIARAEAQRFAKPVKAMAAFTEEDALLESALQNMHLSQATVIEKPIELVTKEVPESTFLGNMVENYAPAKGINELEAQVFQAKSLGCDSIEASPEVIRHFTRKDYPEKQGFFMYKDIRVFIPGRAATFSNSDKGSMYVY